ncbi:hypothetical protein N7509_012759 [Penicillium cosmopolitanum]|uniref:Uncharacterized protein n=1 Tax=Penicillium cosmopolitanum TaxID=1131564 RepID=A0A9W9SJM4_9EURO|nr:uncharacterized protein N7509_012759 [Penicillium cosmopolitanum]KAJ5379640.1 hypothetical protein N7509_012759 [Penicillium cosmopolitanum]
MADRMEIDSRDDSREMTDANQQLERELLQCQQGSSPAAVHSRRIVSLGVSPHYVSHWISADAFRELYQNWKDAILERFQIDRIAFRPYFVDACDHYAVLVPDPVDPKGRRSLGFIKYDKKSSRGDQNQLAGSHGDGLKLAAVALSRDGYRLQVAASRCSWNFHLREPCKSRLHCTITPSRQSGSTRTDWAEDIAGLRFQTERDVAVLIGPGRTTQGRPVAPEEVLEWLQISLDIRGLSYPSSVVETSHGDLLFDQNLLGRIYAHGVLISGTNSIYPFKVGYNFTEGKFNRDRRWLMDRHGLAERVCRIWESALQTHEAVLLPIYVSLLRKTPALMDVSLAADLLLTSTISRIWTYLLHESKGKDFFYCEASGAQDVNMIRETIGKKPMKLSRELWRLLRSTTPIRSAAEELSMLFHNAEVCSPPSTTFSRTVRKGLRVCFALLDSMQGIQVAYVEGFDSRADVVYNPQQRTLKVHRRWLDFDDTHQRTSCRNWILRSAKKESGKRELFFCGHVIEELLSLSISSVFGGSQTPRTTEMRYMRHI